MPIHDWTRVEAGIFHDFHHAWIEEIKRALNASVLPSDYDALAEQFAGGLGPDVLTLQELGNGEAGGEPSATPSTGGTTVVLAAPKVRLTDETDTEFYERKQSSIAIRHVSDDRVIAVVDGFAGEQVHGILRAGAGAKGGGTDP